MLIKSLARHVVIGYFAFLGISAQEVEVRTPLKALQVLEVTANIRGIQPPAADGLALELQRDIETSLRDNGLKLNALIKPIGNPLLYVEIDISRIPDTDVIAFSPAFYLLEEVLIVRNSVASTGSTWTFEPGIRLTNGKSLRDDLRRAVQEGTVQFLKDRRTQSAR